MRIVFMGTPEFAVPSLAALAASAHEVAGVFCQPDRPSGRGNKLARCPVKEFAEANGIPVYQFERLRDPDGVAALKGLRPELVVTAAFGQILSRKLLAVPPKGTVNVHASLLPAYRGPAPINWCVLLGETRTGITTMFTDAGIDTGDMLLQRAVDIAPGESAGALSQRLAPIGAELLLETLAALEAGTCPRMPQDHDIATRHPMLEKEMGRVDWRLTAKAIVDQVRGLDPWPGAYTTRGADVYKLWRAEAVDQPATAMPGTVLQADGKAGLLVAAGQGAVRILEIQAPGAKRMATSDYLRGHPMAAGTQLGGEETL